MDTGAALLRGVLENPECDTARLVYADYLQENDQPARAEFIRVQCEIARLRRIGDPRCTSTSARWCSVCGDCTCADPEDGMSDPGCPLHDPVYSTHAELDHAEYLSCRARVLFQNSWSEEIGPIGHIAHRDYPNPVWDRGFISRLELPIAVFLEHAAAIFAAHPVTEVRLSGTRPGRWTMKGELYGMFFWQDRGNYPTGEYGHHIPREMCPLTEGRTGSRGNRPIHAAKFFPTEADAFAALSRRCVAYGRGLAGLPPLNTSSIASQTPGPSVA